MKNFICFVAIVLMVMGLAIPAFAAVADSVGHSGSSGMGELQTFTSVNTGTNSNTYDSTDLTTPNYYSSTHAVVTPGKCKIVGWDCNATAVTSTEAVFSLLDATDSTTGDTGTMIIAENEATNTIPVSKILPQGLGLKRGLTVKQGPGTSVTVYYIQDRP